MIRPKLSSVLDESINQPKQPQSLVLLDQIFFVSGRQFITATRTAVLTPTGGSRRPPSKRLEPRWPTWSGLIRKKLFSRPARPNRTTFLSKELRGEKKFLLVRKTYLKTLKTETIWQQMNDVDLRKPKFAFHCKILSMSFVSCQITWPLYNIALKLAVLKSCRKHN